MRASQAITVAIADTAYIVRKGLKSLVKENPAFEFVAEAADAESLEKILTSHKPKVLIVDHCCDDCFSIDFIARIKEEYPSVHILVISHEKSIQEIDEVTGIGINNYLLKDCDEQEITDAIISCAKGEQYFCGQIIDLIMEKESEAGRCETGTISQREMDVIRHLAAGRKPREIADLLHISHYTVTTHRKNIYKKLGISHSYELARFALKTGLM